MISRPPAELTVSLLCQLWLLQHKIQPGFFEHNLNTALQHNAISAPGSSILGLQYNTVLPCRSHFILSLRHSGQAIQNQLAGGTPSPIANTVLLADLPEQL